MTTITITGHSDTAGRQTSLLSVIACFFEDIFAGARDGREIEARYHELRRKTPTELARLGLTPTDITRAVANGRIV